MQIRSSLRYWWLVPPQKLAFSGVFCFVSSLSFTINGGSSVLTQLCRFNKPTDIPGAITKTAPDFCTVYVTHKGKLSSKKTASRAAPSVSPLRTQLQQNILKPNPRLPSPSPSTNSNTRGFKTEMSISYFFLHTFQSPGTFLSLFLFLVSCS